MNLARWLIVRAGGECRVTSRYPNLRLDEVAFRLKITVPVMWGTVAGDINLTVPEGSVTVDVPEMVMADPPEEQPMTIEGPDN